jgi:hypothetical protein
MQGEKSASDVFSLAALSAISEPPGIELLNRETTDAKLGARTS